MKVVLFCGGYGMRMRDYSGRKLPKPMIKVDDRPILWHLMKYYAHFGHKEFVLCLGYKGKSIKSYFRDYDECLTNDFVMSAGGKEVRLLNSDIHDWNITFADTGMQSNIAQRLLAAKKYLGGEDVFLANYSDGLTDLPLTEMMDFFLESETVGCFVSIKPNLSYHFISTDGNGTVTDIISTRESNNRINGGFFVFKKEIFDYIREGEELVREPFHRLIQENQLAAFQYDGFWKSMDTFADKREFDNLVSSGNTPWQIWKTTQDN